MNVRFTAPLLAILAGTPAFAEEKLSIEVGEGTNWSKGAEAGFMRYSNTLRFPNFPQQEGFYEFSIGSWNAPHGNDAVALAIGTRERWKDFHLDASAGTALVARKTHLSGTYQQFILRIGAGLRIGKFDFGVYRTHYSNAKVIFDWDGPNVGYDFLTFQAGYILE